MKVWTTDTAYDFSEPLYHKFFTEQTLFFDIETTGFSAATSNVYLIGCAFLNKNHITVTQFFAESKEDEPLILTAFLKMLEPFGTMITFHGMGFDIPYLKNKCLAYHLAQPFDKKQSIDLYKTACSMKFLFKLPNYKQKTIEHFLGVCRDDTFSGGELIDVYKQYIQHPEENALFFLKQHNYDDVLGMVSLLSIFSYEQLFSGAFSINGVESSLFRAEDGTMQKELLFSIRNGFFIPKRVSCRFHEFYFACGKENSTLSVRLFDGGLKFFFDHPDEYYYLPNEDRAIHKSVATYVGRTFRKKATAATCYTKKDAIFVPQYETVQTPVFKREYKDRHSYFELSETFLNSDVLLRRYIMHVLRLFPSSSFYTVPPEEQEPT